MPIDTAEKRRSAAGVGFWVVGPGVTPTVAKDIEWRAESAWDYSGITPTPPPGGAALLDPTALGVEQSLSVTTLNAPLGGQWSW